MFGKFFRRQEVAPKTAGLIEVSDGILSKKVCAKMGKLAASDARFASKLDEMAVLGLLNHGWKSAPAVAISKQGAEASLKQEGLPAAASDEERIQTINLARQALYTYDRRQGRNPAPPQEVVAMYQLEFPQPEEIQLEGAGNGLKAA